VSTVPHNGGLYTVVENKGPAFIVNLAGYGDDEAALFDGALVVVECPLDEPHAASTSPEKMIAVLILKYRCTWSDYDRTPSQRVRSLYWPDLLTAPTNVKSLRPSKHK